MSVATVAERADAGRAARRRVARSALGTWDPAARTHDPVDTLALQATSRVPELVPIRHGRMAASPFAHFRGAALAMALDLATRPSTGLTVQLCGDAHLSNFGGFASPERSLVFDLNDFDETLPGPFEWDVARLAASMVVAARDRGFDAAVARTAVLDTVAMYRTAMHEFAAQRDLEVWYATLDVEALAARLADSLSAKARKRSERTIAKARAKDQLRAAAKLTEVVDGELRFRSDPPLLVPMSELAADAGVPAERVVETITESLESYRSTLQPDRVHLLDGYHLRDVARKVVGVGSVGTRAWVVLLTGRDDADPLVIQVKEAQASVLEAVLPRSVYDNHGQRVVEGQRLLQASSDILLGWKGTVGLDGYDRDFYMRQLWDWKASAAVESMEPGTLQTYGRACGWTLARAHARSGDRIAIAAYLGTGTRFDEAMARWASAYADQNDRDHAALVAAIEDGRLSATFGV